MVRYHGGCKERERREEAQQIRTVRKRKSRRQRYSGRQNKKHPFSLLIHCHEGSRAHQPRPAAPGSAMVVCKGLSGTEAIVHCVHGSRARTSLGFVLRSPYDSKLDCPVKRLLTGALPAAQRTDTQSYNNSKPGTRGRAPAAPLTSLSRT